MNPSGWQLQRSKTFETDDNLVQPSLQDWIKTNKERLAATSESPVLDVQVLLASVLGVNRSRVISHSEEYLNPAQIAELEICLQRLEHGEPLPYVLGEWEFFGLKFSLTPAVLIPRPETELLVETALDWLAEHPQRRFGVDVGTGSACIAASLAVNCAELRMLASDVSKEALLVAHQNILRHKLENRITVIQADLIPPADQPFDLICANLPYIPSQELNQLKVSHWEPSLALDGGLDGLDKINRLLDTAPRRLAPGGLLLCEIEARQGQAVLAAGQKYFPYAEIRLLTDLAGKDRLLAIQS
jgi:release factor glutamine methyltransferase